ncbi:MAG: hypothetical protein JW955_21655 [Sedimentisphaerales bacterium]|nr:hypothetical protein [Sedimentisphaerales bacterium]
MKRSITFSGVLLLFLNVPLAAGPSVDAGSDVTVTALTLPVVVQLAGSASTWWLNGSYGYWCHPQTIGWWKSGGPQAQVDFADASALQTTATFHAFGVYELMLCVSYDCPGYENPCSGSDTVQITIEQLPNQCPTADAGPAFMGLACAQPPCSLSLQGSGWDPDNGPQPLTLEWSQVDGPGTVDFQNANDPTTTATFHVPGTYLLALWCSDGLCSCTAVTTVEVGEAGGPGPGAACALLAHWDFREGSGTIAHDLSGNGHDGTLYGGPQWVAGHDGGALKFDGVRTAVRIPKIADSVSFTYALWLNQTAVGAGYIGLIDHKDWVPGSVHFELKDGHPKVGINEAISPGGDLEAPASALRANEWRHVAVTKSATSLDLYVDGQSVAHRSLSVSNPVILGDGAIGAWLDTASVLTRCFNGVIDDMYVYPCALSENEIRGLMSVGVMDIVEVVDNGNIDDQQACYASLDSKTGTRIDYTAPVLNLCDSGPSGHFGDDEPFGVVKRGHKTAGNVDNLSVRAGGVIRIAAEQAGNWTFGVNSDDGFTLLFAGRSFTSVTNGELYTMPQGKAIRFSGGRAAADTFGVIDLPAGDYLFWLMYHEAVGGAEVEFFAARGSHTAFDSDLFRLVGQKDIGAVGVPGFCDQVTVLATRPGAWSGGAIDSLADARAALASTGSTTRSVQSQFVNHVDPDTFDAGSGMFGGEMPFPNGVVGKDDDDFAVKVTGLLDIPADGVYQIGFNSDDGASLRITGKSWQSIVADATGMAVITGDELINDAISASTFTAGQITLAKGCHAFEAVMFERSGGSHFELFGRGVSDRGIPDPTWHLLRAGGAEYPADVLGLPLVPTP